MNEKFSGWREGAAYYGPVLGIGVVLLVVGQFWNPGLGFGGAFLAAGAATLLFFRDPRRTVTAGEPEIVAPADGTVVAIEALDASPHYEGPCRRVSIFLSLFDVHINRAPFGGRIEAVTHQPGRFRNAMKAETTDCNEANTVRLSTAHGPVTVRQIAGLVARRIVCRRGVGDTLDKGEKFGMIKFGSRTELYLPANVEVCVRLKQKVRAGVSVIARFRTESA